MTCIYHKERFWLSCTSFLREKQATRSLRPKEINYFKKIKLGKFITERYRFVWIIVIALNYVCNLKNCRFFVNTIHKVLTVDKSCNYFSFVLYVLASIFLNKNKFNIFIVSLKHVLFTYLTNMIYRIFVWN